MKKNDSSVATAQPEKSRIKNNGDRDVRVDLSFSDLSVILASLQTMRDGDFSVRLPGNWTGVPGKIADTFNEIVTANQQMAKAQKRVGQVVGKEGRTNERMRFHLPKAAWGEMEMSVNTVVDDLLRCSTEVTVAVGAVAKDNLTQTVK